jgi:glutamate-ammonia-ligase adenylyltransferase
VGLTAGALEAAGVPEVDRVVAAMAPVAPWLGRAGDAVVLRGLAATADPVAALHALEDLLAAADVGVETPEMLLRLLGGSPALAATLVAEGARWPALFARVHAEPGRTVAAQVTALEDLGAADALERDRLLAILRRSHRRELVRIGGRDLLGLATVDDTVRELSALAESTIEVATRAARARLAAEWGGDTPVSFVVPGWGSSAAKSSTTAPTSTSCTSTGRRRITSPDGRSGSSSRASPRR